MDKQRKISRNVGKDTTVRTYTDNRFKEQSSSTYQMLAGEVMFPEPEPLFRQNMVTVRMARGGQVTSVAYPNAFSDPLTGNIHGVYEGPIPGQMVMVGYENGNFSDPFVVNRFPYQGAGNTLTELSYINPMFKAGFHNFDVIMGHFSGAYISLNTGIFPSLYLPGSITVNAITDIEVTALGTTKIESTTALEFTTVGTATIAATAGIDFSSVGDALIGATAGNLELSGLLVKVASATQSMKTLIDSLIVTIEGITTVGSATAQAVSPASILLLEAEKVKWAALLKA